MMNTLTMSGVKTSDLNRYQKKGYNNLNQKPKEIHFGYEVYKTSNR